MGSRLLKAVASVPVIATVFGALAAFGLVVGRIRAAVIIVAVTIIRTAAAVTGAAVAASAATHPGAAIIGPVFVRAHCAITSRATASATRIAAATGISAAATTPTPACRESRWRRQR